MNGQARLAHTADANEYDAINLRHDASEVCVRQNTAEARTGEARGTARSGTIEPARCVLARRRATTESAHRGWRCEERVGCLDGVCGGRTEPVAGLMMADRASALVLMRRGESTV